MEKTTGLYIPVKRTYHSHLDEVDWDNPEMGIYHSDHMLVCDYREGRWLGPEGRPFLRE
jgi:branched-chain amino acid aminotransferase